MRQCRFRAIRLEKKAQTARDAIAVDELGMVLQRAKRARM